MAKDEKRKNVNDKEEERKKVEEKNKGRNIYKRRKAKGMKKEEIER